MKKRYIISVLLLAVVVTAVVVFHFVQMNFQHKTDMAEDSEKSDAPKQYWTCGMHPQVVQDHPGDCPICHMKLTPMKSESDSASTNGQKKILYYWDPMLGPSSIAHAPGKSAMGMDLVPVYENDKSAGPTVVIDPAVVQNMGVRTAEVIHGSLTKAVKTVGTLEPPESGMHDINLKVNGWIEKLYANQEGQHIHKDEVLFDLYSPDLLVAGEELVGAVKSVNAIGAGADAALKTSAQSLVVSARRKLSLLDVSDADIDQIAAKLMVPRTFAIRSPASGAVIEKMVVEGSAVQPGMKLMRIEDHGTLWLDLQVYEDQMALVAVGEKVDADVAAFPGQTFHGTITFIHPHVDHMSRTVIARAVLDNAELSLKPGMYASATILTQPVADAVQVPREAVIDTGDRQIVFVVQSSGHFEPRNVRMGITGNDGRVEILDGLKAGEIVVTSGQFLLDVESRTTEAIDKLRGASNPMPTTAPAMDSMGGQK